jgi:hypothetical protein
VGGGNCSWQELDIFRRGRIIEKRKEREKTNKLKERKTRRKRKRIPEK